MRKKEFFVLGLVAWFFLLIGTVQARSEKVSFTTKDGVLLKGYLWGQGEAGIILSHMYPADQRSWFDFAQRLDGKGYRVLTFDFRGYGESEGQKEISLIHQDLEAAYLFLSTKAKKIFLIGASMGGTASLKIAAKHPVAGVISLSGPDEFKGLSAKEDTAKISSPKLFIATQGDSYAATSAQELYNIARQPKEILIFPGSEHGTDIFSGQKAAEVEKSILQFLTEY